VFAFHRNAAGDIRKFRGLWQFQPISPEEKRQIWLHVLNGRPWLEKIAPTVRDKQVQSMAGMIPPGRRRTAITVGADTGTRTEPSSLSEMLLCCTSSKGDDADCARK